MEKESDAKRLARPNHTSYGATRMSYRKGTWMEKEQEEEQQQQDKKVHAQILLLTLILLHHPLTHGMCPWIGWVGLFMGPPVSPPQSDHV